MILAGPFKSKIWERFFLKSSLDDMNRSGHINAILPHVLSLSNL